MRKTLMLCCPGESIRDQTVRDLFLLIFSLQSTWNVHLMVGGRIGIYASRNSLLGHPKDGKPFGGLDYDYILWVDNDMCFRPDDFHALADCGMDIVGGLYHNTPFTYCAVRITNKYDYDREHYDFLDKDDVDKGLTPVAWSGFGFLLIKQGVFEKLGYPWFKQIIIKNGEHDEAGAEDESFGYRIYHETDYKICVDTAVKLKHLKIEG